ncbi:MAG: Serine/threonine protein kinase PrkC, regulator of stationary phase [Myxococcales bacterium]|nr:Serine/threonine protein kinase PrkC, regulator of stationary phase [Myxococcales bacterium]
MSRIIDAYDTERRCYVILKAIAPEHAASGALQREAAVLEALSPRLRPHVAAYYGLDKHGDDTFLVMERIAGFSLADPPPEFPGDRRELVEFMAKVAFAVAEIHACNVIHRDLKPSNVMLRWDGECWQPVIIDFGLATLPDGGGPRTETGAFKGTFEYAAPEQLLAKSEASPAWDVYALGVMLFQRLTGRTLTRGDEPALRAMYRWGEIPRVSDFAKLDPELDAIVARSMARDRKRFDARQLHDALTRWLALQPTGVRVETKAQRRIRSLRAFRWPAAAGIALVALVLGALGMHRWRVGESRDEQRLADLQGHAEHQAKNRYDDMIVAAGKLRALSDSDVLRAGLRAWNDALAKKPAPPDDLKKRSERDALQAFLSKLPDHLGAIPIRTWNLHDAVGTLAARLPEKAKYKDMLGMNRGKRDHFVGARAHFQADGRPTVHVSLAYHSPGDLEDKVAYSIAIVVDGRFAGVLAASTAPRQLLREQYDNEYVLQVGPFQEDDTQPPPAVPMEDPYLVVVHPQLTPAQGVKTDGGRLRALAPREDGHELELPPQKPFRVRDYRDPVDLKDRFAVVAPIGRTGFVVVVETANP